MHAKHKCLISKNSVTKPHCFIIDTAVARRLRVHLTLLFYCRHSCKSLSTVPPAILIAGPMGCGKTTLIVAVARRQGVQLKVLFYCRHSCKSLSTVPPAILIAGPVGCGKTTVIVAVAMGLCVHLTLLFSCRHSC